MDTALPRPVANADSAAYWNAARERRLLIRKCSACAALHFMPRHLCPVCWSDKLEWVDACEYLGLKPRFNGSVIAGGASPVVMLKHAAEAIVAGQADTILVCAKEIRLPPPGLGEQTDEILHGLGYSNAEIAEFRDKTIV